MVNTTTIEEKKIRDILEQITDPEIPVLTIADLGIIREIRFNPVEGNKGDQEVEVVITPTYSGCPAMDMIATLIRLALAENGYRQNKVTEVLSPAWTTDWMSETGKEKLRAYGIAPPNPKQQGCRDTLFNKQETVQCPHCDSWHTHRISEFGSTPCKALYRCEDCKEPFDYFKCH